MNKYIELAIKEALRAAKKGEVPVGAVLVCNNKVLTKAHNNRVKKHIVTGHAEISVINKACKKSRYWKLDECELYVTLKPCKMCHEVIREANIKKVIYLLDPLEIKKNRYKDEVKYNKFDSLLLEEKYREIIKSFFERRR